MAIPVRGTWINQGTVSEVGASVWGTGINPIHSYYGEGPPLRVLGRNDQEPKVQPIDAQLDMTTPTDLWGYTPEDSWAGNFYEDDRPPWNEQPPDYRSNTEGHPPYTAQSTGGNEAFRAKLGGAYRKGQKKADSLPDETVSEGWLNKITGIVANSRPSDNSQLIVQTSQVQRYQTRVNDHAVARATDAARFPIHSRVKAQIVKSYSGQVPGSPRYYDMTPYQQNQSIRGFRYRTAGVDDPAKMLPNEMYISSPVERVPPPDPSLGISEPASGSDYGYTDEDNFYA